MVEESLTGADGEGMKQLITGQVSCELFAWWRGGGDGGKDLGENSAVESMEHEITCGRVKWHLNALALPKYGVHHLRPDFDFPSRRLLTLFVWAQRSKWSLY